MKRVIYYFFAVAVGIMPFITFAQNGLQQNFQHGNIIAATASLSGKVTDVNGKAVEGATVRTGLDCICDGGAALLAGAGHCPHPGPLPQAGEGALRVPSPTTWEREGPGAWAPGG